MTWVATPSACSGSWPEPNPPCSKAKPNSRHPRRPGDRAEYPARRRKPPGPAARCSPLQSFGCAPNGDRRRRRTLRIQSLRSPVPAPVTCGPMGSAGRARDQERRTTSSCVPSPTPSTGERCDPTPKTPSRHGRDHAIYQAPGWSSQPTQLTVWPGHVRPQRPRTPWPRR